MHLPKYLMDNERPNTFYYSILIWQQEKANTATILFFLRLPNKHSLLLRKNCMHVTKENYTIRPCIDSHNATNFPGLVHGLDEIFVLMA